MSFGTLSTELVFTSSEQPRSRSPGSEAPQTRRDPPRDQAVAAAVQGNRVCLLGADFERFKEKTGARGGDL